MEGLRKAERVKERAMADIMEVGWMDVNEMRNCPDLRNLFFFVLG